MKQPIPGSLDLRWAFDERTCMAGPRNWQPRALTAAHRLADNCCGFWCCRISSVTVRSPKDRAARTARARPSLSDSWHVTRVTSFLCMGRDRSGTPPELLRKRARSSTHFRHDLYSSRSSALRLDSSDDSTGSCSLSCSRQQSINQNHVHEISDFIGDFLVLRSLFIRIIYYYIINIYTLIADINICLF